MPSVAHILLPPRCRAVVPGGMGTVVILSLLMLLARGQVARAEVIFHSGFEWSEDTNRDGWPDRWSRQIGPRFPHYIRVAISRDTPCEGKHALEIRLNGGSVALDSPRLEIDHQFRYEVEAFVRCQGLVRDRFFVVLRFLDSQGQVLQELRSEPLSGTQPWRRIRVQAPGPPPPGAQLLQVRLWLQAAPLADLKGRVWIDALRVHRQAYLGIEPAGSWGLFDSTEKVQIRYRVSGFASRQGELELVVLDHQNRQVAGPERIRLFSRQQKPLPNLSRLDSSAPVVRTVAHRRSKPPSNPQAPQNHLPHPAYAYQGLWQPKLQEPGFYRVKARLWDAERLLSQGSTTLAVLPPVPVRGEHPFGWSFAHPVKPQREDPWAYLVRQLSPRAVKYPLWRTWADKAQRERTEAWVRRLLGQGARVIGVCGDPPPAVAQELDGLQLFPEAAVGEVFSMNPRLWTPSLQETMLSFGLQVPQWQWGADDDHSLVELQGVVQQVAQVRRRLGQAAAFVDVAVPWSLNSDAPPNPPWEVVCFSSRKNLSWAQVEQALRKRRLPTRWWYSVLLGRRTQKTSQMAAQMALQLVVAHALGAQGVFVHQVDQPGAFLTSQNTVGPLAVPWSVTVRMLAGTRYLGEFALGGECRNWLFVGNRHAVWVLWAPQDRWQAVSRLLVHEVWNLWGKPQSVRPGDQPGEVLLHLGPEPVFVLCRTPELLRVAHSIRLKHDRVPSVLGRDHPNQISFVNHTSAPLVGQLTLIPPRHWRMEPRRWSFHLQAGEEFRQDFLIRLPIYAATGQQRMHVLLKLEGTQVPLVVSLPLGAGIPGLVAQATVVNQDRRWRVVRVHLTNQRSEPLQVQCTLVLQGQPRQRRTVNVPAGQQRVLNFVLPQEVVSGSEALLRTYLAEENAFFHLRLRLP